MRGKDFLIQHCLFSQGITPAYAGKRMVFAGRKSRTWDHPRVCGEKVSSTSPIKCLKGSPPRVRGKGQAACEIVVELGITPAYAGKRSYGCGTEQCGRDHPRVCGEKFRFILLSLLSSGSPPRVRGKAGGCRTAAASSGITPAYAGKSLLNTDNTTAARDHPRACGEKPPSCPEMSTNEGSPPRMRGKAQGQVMAGFAFGITPAYAGKSSS